MSEKPPLPDDLVAEIDRLAPQLTLLDHYGVLGVVESSTELEIKTAYLRVIQRFHPDRWHARDSGIHRKRMEAIFARATEAYEVLRRADTKLEYDRSLYEIRGIPRPSAMPKATRIMPPPPPPPRVPAPSMAASAGGERRAPTGSQLAAAARMMQQIRPPTAPPPARTPTVVPPKSTPAAPELPASARVPILVVEDDDTLRRMLVRIFTELGEVSAASDGREALALLAHDPLPRLVVTDVMMPNVDGLELARRMKADARTSRVPIIMLTAKQGPRDLIDGVNAGARIYVTKPFKVDDLKAKAKKAMGIA